MSRVSRNVQIWKNSIYSRRYSIFKKIFWSARAGTTFFLKKSVSKKVNSSTTKNKFIAIKSISRGGTRTRSFLIRSQTRYHCATRESLCSGRNCNYHCCKHKQSFVEVKDTANHTTTNMPSVTFHLSLSIYSIVCNNYKAQRFYHPTTS